MIKAEKKHIADREGSHEPASIDANSSPSPRVSRGGLTGDDLRVITALERYIEGQSAGRAWCRDEFLAQHADIADALGDCLLAVDFIQAAASQLSSPDMASITHSTEPMPRRAQLGDFSIIREVGRGGMGVVYEAEQISLGRRVALKVLPIAAAIDPTQRQRFQIEAQAAAQLSHPHIVPIFNVGCDQGIHYYAMQFVEGCSLAAIVQELRQGKEAPFWMGRPVRPD